MPRLLLPLFAGCVSEQREQEMGDLMAIDINAQLPMVEDPVLNAYVTSLGRALARVSERPGLDYHFYVINSPTVNAFALPGGHIYLTRGQGRRQLRTGSLVSVLYNLILGGEPDLLRRESLELGGALWSARHSRQAEGEADARAVEYLLRAGLDPDAMVSLLRKLVAVETQDSSRVAGWFSSHPLTRERIVEAEVEIDSAKGHFSVPEGDPTALLPEYLKRYPLFLERLAGVPGPSLLR